MRFDVLWSETALKQLRKLEKMIIKRIIDNVEEIRPAPLSYLKKLESIPLYSLRAGHYRVIISIERRNLVVLEVGHRNKIYRKIS